MIVRVRFMCVGASLRVCVRHLIVTISYGTPPIAPIPGLANLRIFYKYSNTKQNTQDKV